MSDEGLGETVARVRAQKSPFAPGRFPFITDYELEGKGHFVP